MIVVLGTNVIISSLLSPKGAPAEIIRRWEADEFAIVTSPSLIAELERALTYPQVGKYLKLSQEEIDRFLKRFKTAATVVTSQVTLEVIEKDPADNRVVECAVAGGAAYIVTGDAHLLELAEYQHVVIVNPVGFLVVLKFEEEQRRK